MNFRSKEFELNPQYAKEMFFLQYSTMFLCLLIRIIDKKLF